MYNVGRMNINDLVNEIERYRRVNTAQRQGQAAFNVLYNVDAALADQIRGTDADPFYQDERLPAFYEAIERLRDTRPKPV